MRTGDRVLATDETKTPLFELADALGWPVLTLHPANGLYLDRGFDMAPVPTALRPILGLWSCPVDLMRAAQSR